jgi:metal transporter CNNM
MAELAGRIIGAAAVTLASGFFSGLTLGLMSLERLELELLVTAGTPVQAKRAAKILPIRANGNYLLCTLILTNVVLYTALPLIISDLASGAVALVVSTALSVVFGEILPQSICSKYGLAIGAAASPLVRLLMVLWFPVAMPMSKALDWLVGEEVAHRYSRDQLQALVAHHTEGEGDGGGELKADESTIVQRALVFSRVTVEQVLTPIDKVFAVRDDTVLDGPMIRKLGAAGHSRVPAYSGPSLAEGKCVGVVLLKSLLLISPEAKMTVRALLQVTKRQLPTFKSSLVLTEALNEFQRGSSHMALVKNDLGNIVGLVTLEGVLEHLIGEPIADEYDFDEIEGGADARRRLEELSLMAYGATKWKALLHKESARSGGSPGTPNRGQPGGPTADLRMSLDIRRSGSAVTTTGTGPNRRNPAIRRVASTSTLRVEPGGSHSRRRGGRSTASGKPISSRSPSKRPGEGRKQSKRPAS